MSSRAWTEVASGAAARSVRRWGTRRASPILVRYLVLLMLLGVAGLIFGELLYTQSFYSHEPRCFPVFDGSTQCVDYPIRVSDIF